MGRIFRSRCRLRVGGTVNMTTGVMTGGVTVGHFMTTVNANITRQTLVSAVSNGITVQDIDPDGDTCEVTIEAEQDSTAANNLAHYWVDGGAVEITTADPLDQKILDRYGVFKMGNFGQSGSKEAAKETATLVGTNSIREAAWLAAQVDLPGAEP